MREDEYNHDHVQPNITRQCTRTWNNFFFDGEDEYNTDTRHDEHEQRAAADYVHVRTDRVGEDVRVGSTRTQAEEFLTTTQRRAKSLFIYQCFDAFRLA